MKISPFVPYTLKDKAETPLTGDNLAALREFAISFAHDEKQKLDAAESVVKEFGSRDKHGRFAECATGIDMAGKRAMLRSLKELFAAEPSSLKAEDFFRMVEGMKLDITESGIIRKSIANRHLAKASYNPEGKAKEAAYIATYPLISAFFEELAKQENRLDSLAVEKFMHEVTNYIGVLNAEPSASRPLAEDCAVGFVKALQQKIISPTPKNMNIHQTERMKLINDIACSIPGNTGQVLKIAFGRAFRYFAGFELSSLPQKRMEEKPVSYNFTVKAFVDSLESGLKSTIGKSKAATYERISKEVLFKAAELLEIPKEFWQQAGAAARR